MKICYVKWDNGDLFLISDNGCVKLDVGKTRLQDVGYIKFKVDRCWQLALLVDNGTACEFWVSEDGEKWNKIKDDPEKNRFDVETDEYILYPHLNSFGILRKNKFYCYIDGEWTEVEIPDGVK